MPLEAVLERIIQKAKENGQDTDLQSQNIQEKQIVQTSYNCECGGTGWIITDGIAKRCKCYELERAKRIWENAGIKPEQKRLTFGTYTPYNEITNLAKETAIGYYKNFQSIKNSRRNSIALWGQVGSGKTHLSVAIAVNLLNKDIPVVYMPYRDVITSIKQNMLDEEYYKKMLSKYKTAKVLLIDDLYKGKINDTDKNIMFEIVNYRYLNCLPIIVSSELKADAILDFDEAIGSRLIEMCKDYIVEITGRENNYRLRE